MSDYQKYKKYKKKYKKLLQGGMMDGPQPASDSVRPDEDPDGINPGLARTDSRRSFDSIHSSAPSHTGKRGKGLGPIPRSVD